LTKDDIGKPRAKACLKQLEELNQYVPVHLLEGELALEHLKDFTVRGLFFFSIRQMTYIHVLGRCLQWHSVEKTIGIECFHS
jgi:hypothetical protein